MKAYVGNIEEETIKNKYFRKVLFTAPNSQLVVMSLKPGEEIGEEVHELDQFIRIESGEAKFVLDEEEYKVGDDWAVVVPAGTKHNVINTSDKEELKLYTIYSPPEHKDGTVHQTKKEAMVDEHSHT